ncbi:MAG TPA: signal peptidase II [Firmicutes bacterium]|nr:signal peptidase II [Bacillota bacterium]
MKLADFLSLCRKKCVRSRMHYLIFFKVALVVFVLDRVSKLWVVNHFNPGEIRPLLDGAIYLTFMRNPGAAFGLFAYQTPYLIAISLILIVLTVIVAHFTPYQKTLRTGLAVMLGGAAGNLFDRLQTGYVVDFIDLRFWPVFNLADVAIVAGVFLMAFGLIARPGFPTPEDSLQGDS